MCFVRVLISMSNDITCLPRFVAVLRNPHITPQATIASDPTGWLRSSRTCSDRKRVGVSLVHALAGCQDIRLRNAHEATWRLTTKFAPNGGSSVSPEFIFGAPTAETRKTTNHEASTPASSSFIDASSISGALTCVVVTVVIPAARFPPRLKA